jgi:glutamate-1-semialdehyde 2,1-aminomutase
MLYLAPSRYNWMFQYYLRARGLSLSWIGTGRLVFSHDLEDEDFVAIAARVVAAAEEMQQDGFWWGDGAVTNQSIKRRVLRELVSALALRRQLPPQNAPAPATRP